MPCIRPVSRVSVSLCVSLLLVGVAVGMFAQSNEIVSSSSAVVPPLVSFSGVLTDVNGKPMTGVLGVTFALYKESQGGVPLWLEIQNVYPDKTGHYTVLLGSTKSTGLPADIFVAGEARWLGVQVQGQAEQPRVSLLSVPYALKSGDAETVGGLPPSAFVRAMPGSGSMTSSVGNTRPSTVTPNVGGKAASAAAVAQTQNYVAKFVNTTGGMGNSLIFDNGTSIGIGTSKPADALDVVGGTHVDFSNLNSGIFGSNLVFGDSTSGEGISSARQGTTNKWGLDFWTYRQRRMSITSTGNVGIGTATPTDALDVVGGTHLDFSNQNNGIFGTNLVFGDSTSGEGISSARQGTTNKWGLDFWTYKQRRMSITSTGNVGIGTSTPGALLEVNGTAKFNSLVTFAAGQTFPGAGSITGVTAGTNLKGGGTTGNVTLSLDTTNVPLLAASNVFTGNQTVNGSLSATGAVTGSSYQIGSNLFAWGSYSLANAFLGFAGNASMTGSYNTATGAYALYSNTTAGDNTANGYVALYSNTTGGANTAIGALALTNNQSGGGNTASGYASLYANTTGSSNTAAGYEALENNTTGSYNTASGELALRLNTVANDNVAVGYQALYSNVGDSNYDGWYNTAVGTGALYSNNDTSGAGGWAQQNTAIGYHSLYSNVYGAWSTAVGYMAASASNTYSNTAVGASAMLNTTSGGSNTAIGAGALSYNTTGQTNTAIGASALSGSNGDYNIAIGVQAGVLLTYGSDNIDIGNPGTATDESDTIRIGANQKATYIAGIYNANVGGNYVYVNSKGQLSSLSSSRRFKQGIVDLGDTTNVVMRLRPVRFRYKSQGNEGPEQYGLIAEEVNEVVPEMVGRGPDGKIDSVHYDKLNILLLNEVQKQHRLLETQKKQWQSKISRLQQQVHAQQAQIEEQRVALKAQAKQSQIQQADITRLGSQIMAIQVTLKNLTPSSSGVSTAKVDVMHQ